MRVGVLHLRAPTDEPDVFTGDGGTTRKELGKVN